VADQITTRRGGHMQRSQFSDVRRGIMFKGRGDVGTTQRGGHVTGVCAENTATVAADAIRG